MKTPRSYLFITLLFFSIQVFAGIGVGTSSPGALPVQLTLFTAKQYGNGIQLNWSTATEVNNYGFEIQKLAFDFPMSTSNWQKIAFVQGHGNSNSPKNYSYLDNLAFGNLKYRLKQIDFDGSFEYSKAVDIVTETPANYSLNQNYPNPFNPSTVISYKLSQGGHVLLKVYDILGKEIVTLVNEFKNAGTHFATFSTENVQIPSGVYIYKLQSGSFSEIKKMSVLK